MKLLITRIVKDTSELAWYVEKHKTQYTKSIYNLNIYTGSLNINDMCYINAYKGRHCFVAVGHSMILDLLDYTDYCKYIFLKNHKYFNMYFKTEHIYEIN